MPTRSNPIPKSLYAEFIGYMDYSFTSDLPDGGWFQMMYDDAKRFMEEHNLKGCPNAAVNQLFLLRSDECLR